MIDARTVARHFRDIIPYPVPERLDDLYGPRQGTVDLYGPRHVGPRHIYDIDQLGDRCNLYEYVLNHSESPATWLHRPYLEDLWPFLRLPVRTRLIWELAFPQLVQTYI